MGSEDGGGLILSIFYEDDAGAMTRSNGELRGRAELMTVADTD